METLTALGGEDWFRLGDRDLAVHVERTRRLRRGESLSAITADFCRRLFVGPRVLPATDDPVRTKLRTDEGCLDFQDYFVVFSAALSCGSLPSPARRMHALIPTFWRLYATNGCAR